jgi:general secretion pathway protein C
MELLPRLARNVPNITSLLLAALILAESVRGGATVWRRFTPVPVATVNSRPEVQSHRVGRLQVEKIISAHLFGVAADDAPPDLAHAAPTTANLVLQGTLATPDPAMGLAIITADGAATVHKAGDDVSGASLHSVYRDHVILTRGGRFETLSIPRLLRANGSAYPAEAMGSPAIAGQPNLAKFMQVEPSVDEQSDHLLGFLISPVHGVKGLIRSGLRPGDLVTAVNGTPLDGQDRQHSQEIVNSMLASGRATVSVSRNGQSLDVALDAAQ